MVRLYLFTLLISFQIHAQTFPDLTPETSGYTKTSAYTDVMKAVTYTAENYSGATLEYFGKSADGKNLPLLIFSDRKKITADDALKLNRPIIFIMGNIHSGEVEGKEALHRLMRDITQHKYDQLFKKMTLLIAPIYSADANDKIKRLNRISQNGPSDGVGERPNSEGFDLNRDFMKLESTEAQHLVKNVFNTWDPVLFVDLHTTNGSYHGYHLTYANNLNPNTDELIRTFEQQNMMPFIIKNMTDKQWNIFEYGNYRKEGIPQSGWETYGHQPRYGTNYYGLRNRLTILSEAYSYLDFKSRIQVTYDFIDAVMQFSFANANSLTSLRNQLDSKYTSNHSAGKISGIEFEYDQPETVSFLTGFVDSIRDAESGKYTYRRLDKTVTATVPHYGRFTAKRVITVPKAYAIDNSEGKCADLITLLDKHGINYQTVSNSREYSIEYFSPLTVNQAAYEFQKHKTVSLTGSFEKRNQKLTNWIYVPLTNSNRNLIMYLLEPESDDGAVTWNFLDKHVLHDKPDFPVVRVLN